MIQNPVITLHAVTKNEWPLAIVLTPFVHQRHLIASNENSLAEAEANSECRPMLIRAADVPVGFAMVALDHDDGNQWIYRFMIDHRHQGRGYGGRALDLLIQKIFSETGCPLIMLGVRPQNSAAIRLYERAGFQPAGFEFDGERAMRLDRPSGLS